MDRSQINLDNFFEVDIIRFLDEKAAKKQGRLKQSILQQAEMALKRKDIETVLNIFEDLTNKYNSVSKSSAYKSLIYGDILELLDVAKKNTEKLDKNSELARIIKNISENEEIKQGELPDVITAFQKIKIERAKIKLEQEEVLYKIQAESEKRRRKVSQNLFVNIRKKQLKESVENYQALKKIFLEYPYKFKEEKEEFYNDILSFYMQIRRLKEDIQEKYRQDINAKAKKNMEIKEKKSDTNAISALKIKEIMFEIKKDVGEKDFEAARSKLIDLKHITLKISDKQVRNILESKINTINQNIDFVRRSSEQKT